MPHDGRVAIGALHVMLAVAAVSVQRPAPGVSRPHRHGGVNVD
jgi:hypothetical protein